MYRQKRRRPSHPLIMYRHKKSRRGSPIRIHPLSIVAVMLMLVITFSLVGKFRFIVEQYAESAIQYKLTNAIDSAVSKKIYEDKYKYENLVQLERDANNGVTALKTDTISINNIKTEIIDCVYDEVNKMESSTLEIPAGNIFCPDFFMGMGPKIKIGMVGLGGVKAEFASSFESAGINQTRHNIIIEVTAGVSILSPTGKKDMNVQSRFTVTDTILVGSVPDSYTYIEDSESSLLGKVNDYTRK